MIPLSVIIATKNNEKTMERCLDSVARNEPSEIIIVDGCSTDGTLEIARKYATKIISDHGKGLGYARHIGAESAREDWISYTDADTVIPLGCYKTMLEEVKKHGYAGIHAQIVSLRNASYWEWAEDQNVRSTFNKYGIFTPIRLKGVKIRRRTLIGCMASIYDRKLILKYKFDPFFIRSCEEVDLCYRMSLDGHKFGVSSAIAYHQHRSDIRSFLKWKFQTGQGNFRFAWKHKTMNVLILLAFYIYSCIFKTLNLKLKIVPYYVLYGTALLTGAFVESICLRVRFLSDSV